jgi:hypothetical protein
MEVTGSPRYTCKRSTVRPQRYCVRCMMHDAQPHSTLDVFFLRFRVWFLSLSVGFNNYRKFNLVSLR